MNLKNKFIKFIGAGVINTVVSYLLYVILVLFINYSSSGIWNSFIPFEPFISM